MFVHPLFSGRFLLRELVLSGPGDLSQVWFRSPASCYQSLAWPMASGAS